MLFFNLCFLKSTLYYLFSMGDLFAKVSNFCVYVFVNLSSGYCKNCSCFLFQHLLCILTLIVVYQNNMNIQLVWKCSHCYWPQNKNCHSFQCISVLFTMNILVLCSSDINIKLVPSFHLYLFICIYLLQFTLSCSSNCCCILTIIVLHQIFSFFFLCLWISI